MVFQSKPQLGHPTTQQLAEFDVWIRVQPDPDEHPTTHQSLKFQLENYFSVIVVSDVLVWLRLQTQLFAACAGHGFVFFSEEHSTAALRRRQGNLYRCRRSVLTRLDAERSLIVPEDHEQEGNPSPDVAHKPAE